MTGRVAYLSTAELEGFYVYDELTYAPLRARGIDVEAPERFAAALARCL